MWQSAPIDLETKTLKSVLTPLAALSVLALAACDQPKPRPAEDAAAPAATAEPAKPAAASAGLAKREEMAGFSLDTINDAADPVNKPATVAAAARYIFPSNVAAALIAMLSLGLLAGGPAQKRR